MFLQTSRRLEVGGDDESTEWIRCEDDDGCDEDEDDGDESVVVVLHLKGGAEVEVVVFVVTPNSVMAEFKFRSTEFANVKVITWSPSTWTERIPISRSVLSPDSANLCNRSAASRGMLNVTRTLFQGSTFVTWNSSFRFPVERNGQRELGNKHSKHSNADHVYIKHHTYPD